MLNHKTANARDEIMEADRHNHQLPLQACGKEARQDVPIENATMNKNDGLLTIARREQDELEEEASPKTY